jgi:hypothetical protein
MAELKQLIQNRSAARLWSCKCTDKNGNNSNWGHIIIIRSNRVVVVVVVVVSVSVLYTKVQSSSLFFSTDCMQEAEALTELSSCWFLSRTLLRDFVRQVVFVTTEGVRTDSTHVFNLRGGGGGGGGGESGRSLFCV